MRHTNWIDATVWFPANIWTKCCGVPHHLLNCNGVSWWVACFSLKYLLATHFNAKCSLILISPLHTFQSLLVYVFLVLVFLLLSQVDGRKLEVGLLLCKNYSACLSLISSWWEDILTVFCFAWSMWQVDVHVSCFTWEKRLCWCSPSLLSIDFQFLPQFMSYSSFSRAVQYWKDNKFLMSRPPFLSYSITCEWQDPSTCFIVSTFFDASNALHILWGSTIRIWLMCFTIRK